MNISLTSSMRFNLLSLQQTQKQMDATQLRLSTGLKVNSAIDNPSAYYTASALNNRAADLSALLDSMGQAVQTIKAAETTLQAGLQMLAQAKALTGSALDKNADITEAVIHVTPKDKTYLEKQDDVFWFTNRDGNRVSSVVTNAQDLLDAAASGIAGNIIVYGDINMGSSSLQLSDNQNLVGVDKYGAGNASQYSKLTFTNLTGPAVSAGNSSKISNLDLKADFLDGSSRGVVYINNKTNVSISDINISYSSVGTVGDAGIRMINNAKAEIRGKINILTTGTTRNYGINTAVSSVLDIYDAEINIKTMNGTLNFGVLNSASVINLHGKTNLNINSGSSPILTGPTDMGSAHFNVLSSQTKIYMNTPGDLIYSSAGVSGDLKMSLVSGATIIGNGTKFTAQSNIEDAFFLGGNDFNRTTNGKDNQFSKSAADISEVQEANAKLNVLSAADFLTNKNTSTEYPKYTWTEYVTKPAMEAYLQQFNDILQQYDNLIADGSYKGVNLLQKDNLHINFNENRSSSLDIFGVDARSSALGLHQADWKNIDDVKASLNEINIAIGQIRSFVSTLGNSLNIITTREDFTESLINTLTEGADKLTLADMNEESANMLTLQTRQQLAINALSLASQATQGVLRLF